MLLCRSFSCAALFTFIQFHTPFHVSALSVNHTVHFPAPASNSAFKLDPAPFWQTRNEVAGARGSYVIGNYHEGIRNATLTVSFHGVAADVLLIVPNPPSSTSGTFCKFRLDGQLAGLFQHVSDGSGEYTKNVLAFRADGLTDGPHTLAIELSGNRSSTLIFDRLVYSTSSESPSNAPLTVSTALFMDPSPSTFFRLQARALSGGASTATIVGAVIGTIAGLLLLGILIVLHLLRRERRRRRVAQQVQVPSDHYHRNNDRRDSEFFGDPIPSASTLGDRLFSEFRKSFRPTSREVIPPVPPLPSNINNVPIIKVPVAKSKSPVSPFGDHNVSSIPSAVTVRHLPLLPPTPTGSGPMPATPVTPDTPDTPSTSSNTKSEQEHQPLRPRININKETERPTTKYLKPALKPKSPPPPRTTSIAMSDVSSMALASASSSSLSSVTQTTVKNPPGRKSSLQNSDANTSPIASTSTTTSPTVSSPHRSRALPILPPVSTLQEEPFSPSALSATPSISNSVTILSPGSTSSAVPLISGSSSATVVMSPGGSSTLSVGAQTIRYTPSTPISPPPPSARRLPAIPQSPSWSVTNHGNGNGSAGADGNDDFNEFLHSPRAGSSKDIW